MAQKLEKQGIKSMFKISFNFLKKKTLISLLFVCFSGGLLNSCLTPENSQPLILTTHFLEDKPSINVCFSPEGNCLPIIIHAIDTAKSKILVHSYSFTSKDLANALIKAHRRGIKVKILFDRSQLTARYSQIHKMGEAGIECLVDPVPGIAHNKS
jgi:hypothetical protein